MKWWLLFFFSLNLYAAPAATGSLAVVTGEYAPYSGEKLPEGGISSRIVKAVFSEMNQPIKIEFIPWIRATNYLKTNVAAGSFPWTKNPEREVDFLYSDAIHKYKVFVFVRKESPLLKKFDLEKKKLCQPSGWDITFMQEAIDKNHMNVERPINMESCLRMLDLGRVDLVVINELVGISMVAELFPKKNNIVFIDNDYFGKVAYLHFIMGKNYPNAAKIMADFNKALQVIKANGKYDLLMQTLKRESLKASCGTCSRLGSL